MRLPMIQEEIDHYKLYATTGHEFPRNVVLRLVAEVEHLRGVLSRCDKPAAAAPEDFFSEQQGLFSRSPTTCS